MFDMFTPGDYIKMLSLACLYVYMHKGKLSREKTFVNFVVLRVFTIHESFLYEIWKRGVLWYNKSEQSAKVYLVFPAVWYAQDGLTDICKVLLSIINYTDLISIYTSYIFKVLPPIDHKACTS